MKQILLSSVLYFSMVMLYAQVGTDFATISREANQYYEIHGKTTPGYKQFKRWEWYNASRLTPDGKIANTQERNLFALQQSAANRINFVNSPTANTGSWAFIGPTSVSSSDKGVGRVNRLAFHPTNENIMYAACATGGLWITTDGGSNWYSYTEGIPNMSLSGVAVNYNNTNTIYILTGDADASFSGARGQFVYGKTSTGVLKSLDGGFSWHHTALQWTETDVINGYKLVMHPSDPNVLMVPSNTGIWRTENGGNSWTNTNTAIDFYDIEFHPTNASIVYASGTSTDSIEIYKSTNSGQSFAKIWATKRLNNAAGKASFNRSAIAVSAANPDYVYLLAGPTTAIGSFHGVYRSTNQGSSFSLRASTPNILGRSSTGADSLSQEGYDLAIAVSASNSSQIACGGIRLWTSTNGGTGFTFRSSSASSTNYYHDDIHDLVYHPLNNGKLYMCADGGVYISTDNGASWSALNNNLPIAQYYKIAINPNTGFGTENILIGGLQDNGTNKRAQSGSTGFSKILGSDGMDCFIDPDGAATYVASIQDGEFYYSPNSGSSFEFIGNPETIKSAISKSVYGRWVTPVAEITGVTNSFIIGYNPLIKITRITPGAFGFTAIGVQPSGGNVSGRTFLKTARGNANRVYAGDVNTTSTTGTPYREIYTTTNGGTDWSLIYYKSGGNAFTDLAFDADNGNKIWLTFGDYVDGSKVFYSSTGGGTNPGDWTNISGTLPNVPINCIVFDDNNGSPDGAVYIGTDIGVFYRDNNLGDWIPFSNGLPVVEITDLEIHKATGMLRAGTYGRGLWETSLYSSCSATITLNTSNTQSFRPYYFQVSQSITSSAVHLGTGAYVYYKAGVETVLSPGFVANADVDNEFKAFIGPCGGGVPFVPVLNPAQVKPLKGFLY